MSSDINEPYTAGDLENALAEATGSEEFAATVFEHHINGRDPLAYAQLVAVAGLKLRNAHAGKPWIIAARVETGVKE